MPEGADPKDNYKDYVLGTYDGVPKTPEWASEICGTPAKDIERLAVLLGSTERASVIMSSAPARDGEWRRALSESHDIWRYGGPHRKAGLLLRF